MDAFSQIWQAKKDSIPLGRLKPVGFIPPSDCDNSLDLNNLMVQNQASTFFIRVQGHAMKNAGIFDDDIVVVDRSVPLKYGDVVIAVIEETFLIRRLIKDKNKLWLGSGNPHFPSIEIQDGTGLEIWGVVTYNIHKV